MSDKIIDFEAYRHARLAVAACRADAVEVRAWEAVPEQAQAEREDDRANVIALRPEPTTLMVAASALARAARLQAQLDATARSEAVSVDTARPGPLSATFACRPRTKIVDKKRSHCFADR